MRRLVSAGALGVGAQAQVVDHGHFAEQTAALRDQSDAGRDDPVRRVVLDRPTLEQNLAARPRTYETGDRLQKRCLAGAVGAENDGGTPGFRIERNVVQRLVLAVGDADVLKPQHRRTPR